MLGHLRAGLGEARFVPIQNRQGEHPRKARNERKQGNEQAGPFGVYQAILQQHERPGRRKTEKGRASVSIIGMKRGEIFFKQVRPRRSVS